MCFGGNWSFSSKLSNVCRVVLSTSLFSFWSLQGLYENSISWNLNFTPDIDNSSLLSFFLCLPNLVILLIFSKNQLFVSLIFFYCFSVFNSTDFSSYPHYFFFYYVQRRNSLWYQSSIHWCLFYGPGYSLSSYTKLNVYQDVRIPRYILLGYEKTV